MAAAPLSGELIPVPPDPNRRPLSITPAGAIATLVLLAVVIVFLRLGFWQLDRLSERRQVNREIAARLDAAPIADAGLLTDTAGLFYRSVTASGLFDDDRSIVLPGRSLRGVPGVYLLTPLRLDGRPDAVLVNRGWIPSPDAATIDFADFRRPGGLTLRALVVPFPDASESLVAAPRGADSAFRRVWYSIDEPVLRAQFPYALMPVMLQELPEPGQVIRRGSYPAALEPPALDEGPHLGYALQWFSFALIGIIGWIALVRRSRSPQRVAPPAGVLLLMLATPFHAHAQLRPLEPFDWRVFDSDTRAVVTVGAGALFDQPAPIAGSVGRLLEAGNYAASLRSGRIAVEISGTALWHLEEESQREQPAPWVSTAAAGVRRDAGPASATTSVLLSDAAWPLDLALRFGARLPTTGFPSGLERDETDFYALAGTRWQHGPLALSMEHGIGIHGAVFGRYPQSDMWLYSATASVTLAGVRASTIVVGQQDGHHGRVRGNEDQRELRLALEFGTRHWVSAQYIHGLTRYSPTHGLRLAAGYVFR